MKLKALGVRLLVIPLIALQKEELYLRLFNELISLLANRPELMFTSSDSKHWIYTLSEE
jgi:hypothetical protein